MDSYLRRNDKIGSFLVVISNEITAQNRYKNQKKNDPINRHYEGF